MPRPRVLALIQAGGTGGRMDVLTRERAKPALPFAGVHQLVDFPLSNLTHSGISDVWLSLQFQGSTLQEEVANGRPWDLDRNLGGLRILLPHEGTGGMDEEGFARGNADELFRFRDELAGFDPDVVLVMSADHVYRLDYNDVLDTHRERERRVHRRGRRSRPRATTPATTASSRSATTAGSPGSRTSPTSRRPAPIVAEVIAYDPTVLREVLEELHRELAAGQRRGRHRARRLRRPPAARGWSSEAARSLTGTRATGATSASRTTTCAPTARCSPTTASVLSVPGWPILSRLPQRVPARVLDGGEVVDSLLSPGQPGGRRRTPQRAGPGRGGRVGSRGP